MSSTAWHNMNWTIGLQELESEPRIENAERTHYWHIQRKARRGSGWKTQGEYYTTKREMARIWIRNFRGKAGYRLRHLLAY